jgi:hypothetical protein
MQTIMVAWYTAVLTRIEEIPSLASLLQESKSDEELATERHQNQREFEALTAVNANAGKSRMN